MEEQIKRYLATDFEMKLFSASAAYLENKDDPLRINSFAYSLRELIRNVFERRAPEEKVKSCSWFKNETDNGKPSRKQRYIYCVQGGLSHKFVSDELGMDVLEPWKEIKKLSILFQSLRTSMKLPSTYQMTNAKVFLMKRLESYCQYSI